MAFHVRACAVPDDCARIAAIINTATPEPVTVQQLEEGFARMPADALVQPLLACDGDNHPVCYGSAQRFAHEAPGKFYIKVITDPDFRRTGAGSFLFEHLLAFAREHGATRIETKVRDNDAVSRAFAEKRGFAVFRHTFESTLDLSSFDESLFAGAVEASEAAGIRFFSLADDPSEENLRRFYDLVWKISPDIPGYSFIAPPPYEPWAEQVLKGPNVRQDLLLVAAEGDRWVGFGINISSAVNGSVYNGGTGVDRSCRGRGIALALKLLAIRRARAIGVPYMRTNNDSENAPILALNRKLGYQPSPGIYEMMMQL